MNTLSLSEAVDHCLEVAENPDECPDCAVEHLQLALWLTELKQLRAGEDPTEVRKLLDELDEL